MTTESILNNLIRTMQRQEDRIAKLETSLLRTAMQTLKPRYQNIAADVITIVHDYYILQPQVGTSDVLETINGGREGKKLLLRTEDVGDTITVKDGTGNIFLDGSDIDLDSPEKTLVLIYDTDVGGWIQYGLSGGGGAGATTFLGLTDTPSSYSGEGGKYLAVNGAESAVEFISPNDVIFTAFNYFPDSWAVDATAAAFKGGIIDCPRDISIHALNLTVDVVAGASYKAIICTESGGNIATIEATSETVTLPGTITSNQAWRIWLRFASPVALTPGTTYYMLMGRTDGGDTYALPIFSDVTSGNPSAPFENEYGDAGIATVAKASPIVGDAITISTVARPYSIGFRWTYD